MWIIIFFLTAWASQFIMIANFLKLDIKKLKKSFAGGQDEKVKMRDAVQRDACRQVEIKTRKGVSMPRTANVKLFPRWEYATLLMMK